MIIPPWNTDLRVFEPNQSGGEIAAAIRHLRSLDSPREGLHCSTILHDMLTTLYKPPKKNARGFKEETTLAYQEIGNVIEDVVAAALRARLGWRKPEPRCYQEIWCSPDGYDRPTRTVDEMKVTWVSMRDFFWSVKFMFYVWQALVYAHVWHAQRIRLHVLFVVGDWRAQAFPDPHTYIIRWKRDVPRQTFDSVRQHALDRGLLHP